MRVHLVTRASAGQACATGAALGAVWSALLALLAWAL
jgi:hypothetical protein